MKFFFGATYCFMGILASFSFCQAEVNMARKLLAEVRGGDYAHAGDEEAVFYIAKKVRGFSPEIQNGFYLDVGSGFGGTGHDMYQMGFKKAWGIDIDASAIKYSQEHYPNLQAIVGDAQKLSHYFKPAFFSFLSLFNVFYAIEDKKTVIEELSKVAKPGAILVIYDYVSYDESFFLQDLAGRPMKPMIISSLQKDLHESGWEVLEVEDFSEKYVFWYEEFLQKLSSQEEELLAKKFSEEDKKRVEKTFRTLLSFMHQKSLGGAAVYARKRL